MKNWKERITNLIYSDKMYNILFNVIVVLLIPVTFLYVQRCN